MVLLSCLLMIAPALLIAGVQPALTAKVTPETIQVDAFYSGADVRVEGTAPQASHIVVVVSGAEGAESFNRKRRFGPVWLTSGKVKISGVPSLLLRFSSAPIATLLDGEAMAGHGLDEASLMRQLHAEPRADGRSIGANYMALKKSDGSYRFGDGGVAIGADGRFALEFAWPLKAPPAEYSVRVLEIRDSTVVREIALPLRVVRTGFPAWLAGMAENESSLYGITAIFVGVLAGFGIDFITTRLFGRKKQLAAH